MLETLQDLIGLLSDRDEQPAIVALQKDGIGTWSFATLAYRAHSLAVGLAEAGLKPGAHAVVFAPNRPEWVIACLALFAAAAVPVPIDAQMGDEDLQHVLADSEARWIFTSSRLVERVETLAGSRNNTIILLDADHDDQRSWRRYLRHETRTLPVVRADEPAVLFYTSGTTGRPKGVPLSHRNLIANLQTLLKQGLIHSDDRLLLPLPLHHVYPFAVGMLAGLAAGVPLIFPLALTGPQLLRALQEGCATAIIGVPRFYTALYTAIESRLQQRGRVVTTLFRAALLASSALRRRLGLRVGRWLFAPLHTWLNLSLDIRELCGAELGDEALSRIETVRDLLREVVEAEQEAGAGATDVVQQLERPLDLLNPKQQQW